MCFYQAVENHKDFQLRITGTDISRSALLKAKKGEYSLFETRNMPQDFITKYMMPAATHNDFTHMVAQDAPALRKHRIHFRVKDHIRKGVHFGLLNLVDQNDFWIPMQDIVFCQNVLVYFTIEDRATVISMLLRCLNPGGYLFLAPGESINLRMRGATMVPLKDTLVYRRDEEDIDVCSVQ
jgi:chemotaxis protein methyltransferase CheR